MFREIAVGGRLGAIALALVTLTLMALMVVVSDWRTGDRPPASEYAMSSTDFIAWEQNFAARYAVGGEVRPPPGDVPVLARRFAFEPPLQLRVGRTYRLHVAAVDVVHSVAVDGREALLVPGRVTVIVLTPREPGSIALQCGEYCGLGHSRMRAEITVTR